jgi:hypothetical protein
MRMKHWLAATGATHPGAIFSAFISNTPPEVDREKFAFPLAIELSYFGVAVRIGAHWAAEIAGIDD